MYTLTSARQEDLQSAMDILNAGREFQRLQGFVQWPDGFPDEDSIRNDLLTGNGYVLKVGDEIAAYLYIGFEGDPAYPAIKGSWHHEEPYAVIHRMAVSPAFRGQGIASIVFSLAEQFCAKHGANTLRIDTGEQNMRMQHVLIKNGYSYCGTVIQGGGYRMAFDKKLKR